jgi:hypothetical protein
MRKPDPGPAELFLGTARQRVARIVRTALARESGRLEDDRAIARDADDLERAIAMRCSHGGAFKP